MAVFGVGAGFITSQMSLIITEAISQQSAMQSGGIEAAARNVGEAMGVAVLGSVLLITTTSAIKNQGLRSDQISCETKELIVESNTIPFMDSRTFDSLLDDYVEPRQDKEKLRDINAHARQDAARTALHSLIVLMVVSFVLFNRRLPRSSLLQVDQGQTNSSGG